MSYWAGKSGQSPVQNFAAGDILPAFHSVQGQSLTSTATSDLPITYQTGNRIRLNSGNVMDNNRGIFTTPLRGIYYFFFAAVQMPQYNPPGIADCSVQILRNGNQVVTVARADNNAGPIKQRVDQISLYGQATLLLEPGETMSAKLMSQCVISNMNDIAATFMGFLIVPVPSVG